MRSAGFAVASCTCHCKAGTKQRRLERIVRPRPDVNLHGDDPTPAAMLRQVRTRTPEQPNAAATRSVGPSAWTARLFGDAAEGENELAAGGTLDKAGSGAARCCRATACARRTELSIPGPNT
jgi:hypothetical protein